MHVRVLYIAWIFVCVSLTIRLFACLSMCLSLWLVDDVAVTVVVFVIAVDDDGCFG